VQNGYLFPKEEEEEEEEEEEVIDSHIVGS